MAGLAKVKSRLELSRAKHRSLAGHARIARGLAGLVPFYEFDEHEFFRSDGAPEEIAARRRRGFMRLAQLYGKRFSETRRLTAIARESISDLQFTDAYRVPFQYSRIVREHLRAGSFLQSSRGVVLTDLTGIVSTTWLALMALTFLDTIFTSRALKQVGSECGNSGLFLAHIIPWLPRM